MNDVKYLESKILMLESDKRLMYKQIEKLRKEKRELKKQLKEKEERLAYLDEAMYLHQVNIFDKEML